MAKETTGEPSRFFNLEIGFYLSILILVGAVISVTWWAYSNWPPEFPLYYSLSYGNDQLADKNQLIKLTGLVVGISIFNILIASFVIKRKTPSRLLLGITSAWLILYTIGILFISRRII